MPMDYDDNDTSRHNCQLAGEGRSRSSSALRPYDFPKFDFDDSLQGHLRFDSLVETEVFLGIQSQEDNQWIEDFSRGSNGMEFNSTPADSCSISRRNNVWSEATSSESVEMLLKSVGQEEMMPGASIVPESKATEDHGTPYNHVDTSDKRNDAYVASSDTTLPPDEVLKDHPASSRSMEKSLEDPSATPAKVESECANSRSLNQNALRENSGTKTNEGKQVYPDECAGEKLDESKTAIEKTINCGSGRDSMGFPSITDNNANSDIEMLCTSITTQQVKCNDLHDSCSNDGQEKQVLSKTAVDDTAISEGNVGITGTNIFTTSSSLGLVTEFGRDSQEASLDSVKESKNILVKTGSGSELKSLEGESKNTSFSTSIQTSTHKKVLAVSNEMDEPLDHCQDVSSVDAITQHDANLGSYNSGHCASTVLKKDPAVQLPHKQDNDNIDDVSASPLKYENMSEMPLLSMEDNEVLIERGHGISSTNVDLSSDTAVLSSSTADHKNTKNVEHCHNVGGEECGANLIAHDMDTSIQVNQENLVLRQADFSESVKDICKPKETEKEVSCAHGNTDSEIVGTVKDDHRTQSLEVGKGVEGNSFIRKSQLQTSSQLESAKNVSPLVTINATVDNAANIGAEVDNDCEAAETKKNNDTNLGADVDNASEAEISAADDVGIPQPEMAAKSQQPGERIIDVCNSRPLSVEAMQDSSQVHSGGSELNLKESFDTELVSGVNHEKAMSKEEEKDSAHNAEFDKVSCGSPTIISSSEPSQTEKDYQEEGRGDQVTNEFVKHIQSTSGDLKRKDIVGDDSGFTFKVNALPDSTDRESGKNWSPFPDVGKCKVVETPPSAKGKTEKKSSQKTPRQKARVSDGETGPGTAKGTAERKGRRGSAKGTPKENVKKGNQSKGIQENASSNMEKVMLSAPSSSPHVQFGQMQSYGNIETSSKKPSAVVVPTSSLPDLNTSALNITSSVATFRQPFTDLQQVQLRAQIFVYGSLIQGTAPDEACMVSAFGPADGGRSTWETIWRVAVERVRNQKSSSTAAETPSRSQSGARALDAVKQGSHSSKVLATPVSRASSKDTPTTVINPMIPLSSPLWNVSTPRDSLASNAMHKGPVVEFQQAVTSVQSYQTPPIRNFVGQTSWQAQPCFPSPWMASPQNATFGSSVRFHPVTMTETVKLTPIKDTSAVLTSSVKQTTCSPAIHTVSPSLALGGVSALHDPKIIAAAELHSVDSKPRKRKKAAASDAGQIPLVSDTQTEVVISDAAALPSSTVGLSVPALQTSDAIMSKSVADATRVSSFDHPNKAVPDTGKAVACSEETLNKVAEAKSQAEDAADLATAAVCHCEDLWGQLAKQKGSGLTSEAEAKLASAAVAIAAAASVAKAAAAAANIACNAALQAKQMAEEVFLSSSSSGTVISSGKPSSDVHDIGNATPAFIFKSDNVTNQSSSILVAAKEAAKRRVEAASAASKQAENLDAIVKAAELAAAAVSQAGKIVAMGEPLPLKDLIQAGPEGYWKSAQPSPVVADKVRDGNTEQSGAISSEEAADIPLSISADYSVEKAGSKIVGIDDLHPAERPNGLLNTRFSLSDGPLFSKHMDERDYRSGIDHKASDASKSGEVASEPDAFQRTTDVKNESDLSGTHAEDIKEGSLVEVFKPGNGLKSAWYTANVLRLEDGKAYVCYNDLSDEGTENLQEWICLEVEEDKAPIIRAAHPSSSVQCQQTRKRRRAALGDYAWCLGDRVDVWIDDCWWEGVVVEKNEKDETTLKVHIPAQGETSTVRAWNLRASRSWINGKWIEWSSSRGQNTSEQTDTPQEKRQKLGTSTLVAKAKDKELNNVDQALGRSEQSKFLFLSTSEKTFDIGKTTIDDNKRAARRPLRTNQPKEGSRVVFGVPKPTGKKRKFMEVSNFPANKNDKSSGVNDSVKFSKFLMPQGTTSRGLKVPSRNDSKEKRTAESKPRVPSTRKAQRAPPQRENFTPMLAQDADALINHGTGVEDSVGHDENTSEKSFVHGYDPCEEAAEAPLSSLLPQSLTNTSKKISSSNARADRLNRGKLGPTGGKLSKIEEDKAYSNTGKQTLDVSEPRRSNRTIQPTHRLLEGLQSSMVIPKMPSVSHDKGRRNLPGRGK